MTSNFKTKSIEQELEHDINEQVSMVQIGKTTFRTRAHVLYIDNWSNNNLDENEIKPIHQGGLKKIVVAFSKENKFDKDNAIPTVENLLLTDLYDNLPVVVARDDKESVGKAYLTSKQMLHEVYCQFLKYNLDVLEDWLSYNNLLIDQPEIIQKAVISDADADTAKKLLDNCFTYKNPKSEDNKKYTEVFDLYRFLEKREQEPGDIETDVLKTFKFYMSVDN